MSLREVSAAGFEAVLLATELLQRARRADPGAGVWEAADVQWRWRSPRLSDDTGQLFWFDGAGPAAGVLLSSWAGGNWQCDPVIVPGAASPEAGFIWERALEHAAKHSVNGFDVPVAADDAAFRELARQSGLIAGHQDSTAWLDAADRPAVMTLPEGFVLTDRTQRAAAPHPMQDRNGHGVAQRLEQCPLYDPALDLAVEAGDGRVAAYSLYWFDPTTGVGLVEPVRTEDAFQRRGLARAMLCTGIERLAARGARRIKISFKSDAASALYQGLGFQPTSTTTWYRYAPAG